MNRTFLIFIALYISIAGLGFKCGDRYDRGEGRRPAEKAWDYVKEASGNQLFFPQIRPPEYRTTRGARVYSQTPPSAEALRLIDEGIGRQLVRSTRPHPGLSEPNAYLNWRSFDSIDDYNVLLLAPDARSQSTETMDCGLIVVNGVTAIGANIGVKLLNGRPVAHGGVYLAIANLDREAPECKNLFRSGVDHESEHARLMDAPSVWLFYQANDVHPLFPYLPGEDQNAGGVPHARTVATEIDRDFIEAIK